MDFIWRVINNINSFNFCDLKGGVRRRDKTFLVKLTHTEIVQLVACIQCVQIDFSKTDKEHNETVNKSLQKLQDKLYKTACTDGFVEKLEQVFPEARRVARGNDVEEALKGATK